MPIEIKLMMLSWFTTQLVLIACIEGMKALSEGLMRLTKDVEYDAKN